MFAFESFIATVLSERSFPLAIFTPSRACIIAEDALLSVSYFKARPRFTSHGDLFTVQANVTEQATAAGILYVIGCTNLCAGGRLSPSQSWSDFSLEVSRSLRCQREMRNLKYDKAMLACYKDTRWAYITW